MMDNVWNVQGVLRHVHEAQVMTLLFPLMSKVLVIDMRTNERDGPFFEVDDVVGGPRERVRSLQRWRPRFPAPENIAFGQWWSSVKALAEAGALEDLAGRLERLGSDGAKARLDRAYRQLLACEREELLALIHGDPERTRPVWPRS
ncbi:MAG: hypothetical protein ACRDF8_05235 [Chloroflexota bacterium]